MKNVLKLLALLLLSTLLLASPLSAGSKQEAKTLNMALAWFPADLEPSTEWNGWLAAGVAAGENLLQIDENLELKPKVAESWEIIDSKTTVFKIRTGVTFHNGKVVTAQSCKDSIERAFRLTGRKDVKFPLESMSVSGDKLTIKTSTPYATLLNILADPVYIIVDTEAALENPEAFRFNPVMTGPFKIEFFKPGSPMKLVRHDNYWGQKTNVEAIDIKNIKDPTTRAMALQSGEVDFVRSLTTEDLITLEKDDRFVVDKGPNLRVSFIRINFNRPILKNLSFRKALMHGISKDMYAEKIARAFPARGPFADMLPFGYGGDEFYPYNPEKAKQLLDTEGFIDTDGDGIREKDGKNIVLELIFGIASGDTDKNIGAAMQSQLKSIGIGIKLQQYEFPWDIAAKGEFDLHATGWTSAPTGDPQYFLDASYKKGGTGNHGGYYNAEFEDILSRLAITLDTKERYRLGLEANNFLIKDVASIFTYYQIGNTVRNNRVHGVYRFPTRIHKIDERLMLK